MKKKIARLLPGRVKQTIKARLDQVNVAVIRFFALNGFLSSVYYAFFSRQFQREHRAVLLGRLQYWASLAEIGESCVLLRRNIHRLEKGLIMRPRRERFAEAYIGETVTCYVKSMNSTRLCPEERKWATDVLRQYFSVVGSSPTIDRARRQFESVGQTLAPVERAPELVQERPYVPYPQSDAPPSPVSYEQLQLLYRRRRSVRWYLPKPVDLDLIRQAVNAASLAPSACNRQPFRFHVVNDPARAADIANCAMGTAGFADNLQCVIAVVGDLSSYPSERDRHVIYIDGGLASMQLMLALETLGL